MLQYNGIQFMAKGTVSTGGLVIILPHKKDGEIDNCTDNPFTPDSLTSYDDFLFDFADQLQAEWTLIRVPFSEFYRGTSTALTIEEVLLHAKEVVWEYQTSNGEIDVWIDDVAFYKKQ